MIQCCPFGSNHHPQCLPIRIPDGDPFYSKYQENCMNFVRTAKCPQCKLGPRQQMNQITAYIDGSMIYGSMENETRALWTRDGPGELRRLFPKLFIFMLIFRLPSRTYARDHGQKRQRIVATISRANQ